MTENELLAAIDVFYCGRVNNAATLEHWGKKVVRHLQQVIEDNKRLRLEVETLRAGRYSNESPRTQSSTV
jgi:hypothetical protein